MRWHFYIRSTLFWHNGDPIETPQLRQRLLMLLTIPALRTLFASISRIDVTHAQRLTITLHRPDYWLPFRLASYCSVLAHPDDPTIGSGPFRLKLLSPELVRLENHPRYHLNHPLIQAVEYWITPQLFEQDLGTSCRHPVQITIGDADELAHLRQVSNSISLGFCYLTLRQSPRLSKAQAQRLVALIHRSSLLETLPLDEDLITPSNEVLPGWSIPQEPEDRQVPLPERLTLLYHLPVELHTMAEQLRQRLSELGCRLTLIFHDAKNWDGCQALAQADLIMGDRLIGEAPEYTLEQWLRCDAMWPNLLTGAQYAHLQATLDAVQTQPDERSRNDALRNVFNRLMDDAIMTPLFNYNYRISAPPGVNGLRLNARGWFDFASAWLPASSP
ncbi:Oligopeptide ABC transporter, periplasmic oligopeptide-binding protein OppA (TC 3.A.1.5.1) [Raoultella terrigena]|uniref:Oligopeptide ABC transporter, periplasmic oligopeptide-binding protein OppA (TC 3.A.1.5.1) n=1 Tax=Raoultella terrigena TaxID=577 RepID=A0A7Z8ZF12_RAOTE|nr:Oligopeptide ABC transporter, periplasmic oligopeptide-binding protein OppA (TC 3.A.1.5.1) [Raoultella terrigena]